MKTVTPTPIGDPRGFVAYQIRGARASRHGMKMFAEAKILDRTGASYDLAVYRSGVSKHAEWVLWTLSRGKTMIGAGRLVRYSGAPMHEKYAAIEQKYQKKGLYSTIITALRRLLRTPIESDKAVSEGAVGAWKKAGAKVATRDGEPVYRINPSGRASVRLRKFIHDHPGKIDLPTAVAIQAAIADGKKVHFQLLVDVIDLAERRKVSDSDTSELLRMIATYDVDNLRNDDSDLQDFLRRASRLLRGHGVESFPDSDNEMYFTYVNMGDSYASTLAHDGDKLLVTSYGDWIEWAEMIAGQD